MPASPCRLSVFLARKAPVGVILRRGPSRWAQLALWNRNTDQVQPGQWLHGRVYEQRCDLSPDGSLFLYFAAKHGSHRSDQESGRAVVGDAWTAISRPPFFTALALWANLGSWYGGGIFRSGTRLELDIACSLRPLDGFGLPPRYTVQPMPAATAPWEQRLLRDYWALAERGFDPRSHRRIGRREIWEKQHPNAALKLCREIHDVDFTRYGGPYGSTYWIEADDDLIPLPKVIWVDWDSWQRLALVREGRLFVAEVANGRLNERLIFDFNPLRPHSTPAPDWATHW